MLRDVANPERQNIITLLGQLIYKRHSMHVVVRASYRICQVRNRRCSGTFSDKYELRNVIITAIRTICLDCSTVASLSTSLGVAAI